MIKNRTEYWIIVLNNQRIAPKSTIEDLSLNVKITYNVSKEGKIYDIGTFVCRFVSLSVRVHVVFVDIPKPETQEDEETSGDL